MPAKMKLVITHNTISDLFEKSEKEKNIFNKFELFAPEQMKLRMKKECSYYSKETKEKKEKES